MTFTAAFAKIFIKMISEAFLKRVRSDFFARCEKEFLIMQNSYRTHTTAEISESDVGRQMTMAGWIESIRDHGGVSFIDLRDHYGVVQVVIYDDNLLKGLVKEACVSVKGVMKIRDEDTYNDKIASGTIELDAKEITLLGRVRNPLPFETSSSRETKEELRLKYRFLDLRNRRNHENILFRSEVLHFVRNRLHDMGFTEIQTPILSSSSPEGARDYIVPSRKHKGQFYALPQAPQIYKQLLMVSGYDKYFQIAPCFRDEDARADRSPGEFYQIDFEMSFATQEDVFRAGEELLTPLFEKFAPEGCRITQPPYPVISYRRAMLEFGTDKPDLRNPLRIVDATDFFQKCSFAAFKNRTVRAIRVPNIADKPNKFFKSLEEEFAKKKLGMAGLGYLKVSEDDRYEGPIDKFIPEALKPELREIASLEVGDVIFFIADHEKRAAENAGMLRNEIASRLDLYEKNAYRFCFVNDFPMYEIDEETGTLGFTHNPFSMPQGGLKAFENNPLDILAYQYDIVCNGVELSSGAVRNHDIDVMVKAFETAGYDEATLKEKFSSLYNAFSYGAPPHAGMAPGLDRILMLLKREENIREVIAFPMNGNAQDLLLGAPGFVTERQLREAHIKVR